MELWMKNQLEPPYNFIFNGNIQEYDISKANINMLKAFGAISDQEYNSLYSSEKQIREKIVGEMEKKNKEIVRIIHEGIIEAKHQLFITNSINNEEVVRIANDSVYVNRQIPLKNNKVYVNNYQIEFALKNIFTSMVRLGKVLIFVNTGSNNGGYVVDIKGISKEKHMYHTKFVSIICGLIEMIEKSPKEDVLRTYHDLYNSYINRELPIEYYREFKATSCYRIKGGSIGAEFLDEQYKDKLDINHNLYCLRELYKIIMSY